MRLHPNLQEMHKYRFPILLLFVFCMMATLSFLVARGMHSTLAAPVSGFNPGNIISDAVMANYNSMSIDDIQYFLSSKNKCNNTDYQKYLKLEAQYPNSDWHFENGHFICLAEERFGDGMIVGSGQTAAEIIYQAAQDYRINPQVLIVLLEKEQSLITDTYPSSRQYRSATGYGCPDTAPCNAEYYGFKNQVRKAAALFRTVLDGGWSNYPAGSISFIQYNPAASCGGTNVYIENRATSALYRYTPYQPNASALNAGYGTGDGCGAYGNRNFYLYFRDWFGSTQAIVDGTSVVIPDGVYALTSKLNNNQFLDIAGGRIENLTNVQIWEKSGSGSHQWEFKRNSNGYYTITDIKSGRRLDLYGAETTNGANIGLYDANDTCAQQWKLYQTPDGALTIESACSTGMVLDVNGGYAANGRNVQLWIANNTNAQKWLLNTEQPIPNGYYTIKSTDTNKLIEVAGAYITDSANIQTWTDNKTIAQKWYFSYNSDTDDYTIINPRSGKSLDVAGGLARNATNVQLYTPNHSCAQRWKAVSVGNQQYTFISACSQGVVLDGDKASGNVQVWATANHNAQKWVLTPVEMLADGTYIIRSRINTQQVIDLAGASTLDGANIQTWSDNGTAAQKWYLHYNTATGFYNITDSISGKSIDLVGALQANGTNIHNYSSNNTCAQNWRIIPDENNYYTIFSACRQDGVIDIYGGVNSNGANIQLYQTNNTNAQKWDFIKQ